MEEEMTNVDLQNVQRGWKVFAGDQEIGNVAEVATDELTVAKGTLVRHAYYRIPADRVAEAADGVVDVEIDPAELTTFETKI